METDLLQCPTCSHDTLSIDGDSLGCEACGSRYPIVDGIPDLTPTAEQTPDPYRAETLSSALARVYDKILPVMSRALWRCPPLRFVDWAHMVAGRARGGVHLALPINTGRLYQHIWGEHMADTTVVGVEQSWDMLRRARKNLRRAGVHNPLLVRALPHRLPFKPFVFDSVSSFNGVHAFTHRDLAWREMKRVSAPGGLVAGSTLLREPGRVTNGVLNFYERKGVMPMPHSKDFVVAELGDLADHTWSHETYGAVMFFSLET